MLLGFHQGARWQNIKCEYLVLNGDSHNHVIFGRAALWLHRYHLNRVATFFCSSCSIQIHQAHALFSWNTVKWLLWNPSANGAILICLGDSIQWPNLWVLCRMMFAPKSCLVSFNIILDQYEDKTVKNIWHFTDLFLIVI